MNKQFFIITIIICFITEVFPQVSSTGNVARIGGLTITGDEFSERYEMTPGPNRHRKSSTESQKLEFLFSLIGEKLWALEGYARGIDTTETLRFVSKEFERMFVRDRMFQVEVRDKINVTEQEVAEGLIKNTEKLFVNFLFSENREEIQNLYSVLTAGVPFDSILAESPEREEQIKPIEVVFGQMAEDVEDSLYSLKVGQYTSPILTPDGWYIFKLVNRVTSLMPDNMSREDAESTIRKAVESRKLIDRQRIFYAEFLRDKKVDINPVLFESLAQKISRIFEYKKNNLNLGSENLLTIQPADVLNIEDQFGQDSLKMFYIIFDDNPVPLSEFIRILAFDGYNATDYKINFIRASLNQKTRMFVEQELIYREGKKRGYDKLPELRNEIETWKQHYLFEYLKAQMMDSVTVTDQEVLKYYNKMNQPETYPKTVNIIEILTDSLETVQKIFSELDAGADFSELAKKYNKRDWTQKTNGEYGLFPTNQFGEIGKIASEMEVGEIYGPLQVPEGYSIFKLIDKRDEQVVLPKPFEKYKAQYEQQLKYRKMSGKIAQFTYNLAVKYGVSLNLDALEQIKVTNLPSFGIRFLGFGGKMTAVPLIAPNVEWAEKWIKTQQNPQLLP